MVKRPECDVKVEESDVVSEVRDEIRRNASLVCFEEQQKKLKNHINQFAKSLQGTSMVVLGPKGCGKTRCLESVMADCQQSNDHRLTFVRLNGRVQTDDKIAAEEIAYQLMQSDEIDDIDDSRGSFSELISRILDKGIQKIGPGCGIVIVLDGMDLFASHHNQGLLYSLLDATHQPRTPLMLIGVTSIINMSEMLEKRVRSRLSTVRVNFSSQDWDEKSYWSWAGKLLHSNSSTEWNDAVKKLMSERSIKFRLNKVYHTNPYPGLLKQYLRLVLECLQRRSGGQFLTEDDFKNGWESLFPDAHSFILSNLSMMELTILLSIRSVQEMNHEAVFNFESVFDEYRRFVNKKNASTLPKQRPVLMKAFERLENLALIQAVSSSTTLASDGQKAHRGYVLELDGRKIGSVVLSLNKCPAPILNWAKDQRNYITPFQL